MAKRTRVQFTAKCESIKLGAFIQLNRVTKRIKIILPISTFKTSSTVSILFWFVDKAMKKAREKCKQMN